MILPCDSATAVPTWVSPATALAAVVAALAAVIVGPLVSLVVTRRQNETSLRIAGKQNEMSLAVASQQNDTNLRTARQQIRADVISASRHRWMEMFRNTIAEYLSAVTGWAYLHTREPTRDEAKAAIERVVLPTSKIALLLNRSEDEHQRLIKAMNNFLGAVSEGAGDATKIKPFRVEITLLAADILKHEWERTKTELDEW